MVNEIPTSNPNIPTPQTSADNLAPAAFDIPPETTTQTPAQTSAPAFEPQQPAAAPVATPVPPAPSKRLPSPVWFWYGLSGLTWIVGVVLAVIYISRRDKLSKRFGWFSLLWSFLFLAIVAALILFNYYVLDTVG